jgi:hypothetical protein
VRRLVDVREAIGPFQSMTSLPARLCDFVREAIRFRGWLGASAGRPPSDIAEFPPVVAGAGLNVAVTRVVAGRAAVPSPGRTGCRASSFNHSRL